MSPDYELGREIERLGADIFGVADLRYLKGCETHPEGLLDEYTRGISIGVKLPDDVFELFPRREIYGRVYDVSNRLLDEIALRVSGFIERRGRTGKVSSLIKRLQELRELDGLADHFFL